MSESKNQFVVEVEFNRSDKYGNYLFRASKDINENSFLTLASLSAEIRLTHPKAYSPIFHKEKNVFLTIINEEKIKLKKGIYSIKITVVVKTKRESEEKYLMVKLITKPRLKKLVKEDIMSFNI